jgi:hypothetical protein
MLKTTKQDGFVSLLTAIILCLLLLAITVSLIGLQALTLRKADDSEQSQLAYYAAESGVEDAVAKITTGAVGSSGQSCPGGGSLNTNLAPSNVGAVGWTCQSISMSSATADDIKQHDTAITIDPYKAIGGGGFNTVTLLWDQTLAKPASYFAAPTSGGNVNFSGGSNTWYGHALPLELTVVGYPAGSFNASQVNTQSAILVPGSSAGIINYSQRATYTSGSAGKCANANIGGSAASCGLDTGNPYKAKCTRNFTDPTGLTTGTYNCSITIRGLNPASNYLFRLQSRFNSEDGSGNGRFVMYFQNNGALINGVTTTATIDVTGKSGDVYRRVVYKMPLNSLANPSFGDALLSEAGLCQDYQVIGGAPTPPNACP